MYWCAFQLASQCMYSWCVLYVNVFKSTVLLPSIRIWNWRVFSVASVLLPRIAVFAFQLTSQYIYSWGFCESACLKESFLSYRSLGILTATPFMCVSHSCGSRLTFPKHVARWSLSSLPSRFWHSWKFSHTQHFTLFRPVPTLASSLLTHYIYSFQQYHLPRAVS